MPTNTPTPLPSTPAEPEVRLVSWAGSMCRQPWPCNCRGEYPGLEEAAPEAKKGEFVEIINDVERSWRLRRSIATVKTIIERDGGQS